MPTPEFHIDTPRLIISCFGATQDAHCDFLVTVYNTPQALVSTDATRRGLWADRASARKNIESHNAAYQDTVGYGRFLVSLKPAIPSGLSSLPLSEFLNSCTMIGTVSLKRRPFKNAPLAPDVGYSLLPAFMGKGYATEAAGALVRWAEENMGQREFFGFCDGENEGSKAVLRRMGFEERGMGEVKGIYYDGFMHRVAVFSKGLKGELSEYGIGQ